MVARATWVWERPAPDDLLAWVRARGVRQVFVSVRADSGSSGDLDWVRLVVELLHGHGIRVDALGGDKSWVGNLASALAWQRAAVETRLFDGDQVARSSGSEPSGRAESRESRRRGEGPAPAA